MENKRGQTDVVASVCLVSDAQQQVRMRYDKPWASRGAQMVKSLPAVQETQAGSLDHNDPLHGNPLHNSCLENPMDRGAWQATVHGVAQSDTTEHLTSLSPGLISGPFRFSDMKATLSFKDPGSGWAGCHLRCPAPCIRFQ